MAARFAKKSCLSLSLHETKIDLHDDSKRTWTKKQAIPIVSNTERDAETREGNRLIVSNTDELVELVVEARSRKNRHNLNGV